MRCLYCGKELALFKRLTSGGEFCSDAHRQRYQEEYNQLALNRLLQAKPPADVQPPEAPAEEPARATAPAQTPVTIAAPPASAPVAMKALEEPPEQVPVDEPVPADPAGFFLEFPVPVMAEVMSMSSPDLDLEYTNSPAVPQREFEAWRTELITAGRLVMERAVSIWDWAGRGLDRRLDVREFVRGAPVIDVDLPAAAETEIPEAIHEPMEIPTVRYPPQEVASLWQQPAQEFTKYELELGELARVLFVTTGIEQGADTAQDEPRKTPQPVVVLAPLPIPAPPVAPAAQNAPSEATISSVFRPMFSNPNQNAMPPVVEKKPEPVPELITRPMPVTLHGVAAGRGKPVQVFTAGVAASVDVQVPRSVALPLRPVMTLEFAPKMEGRKAERTVVVKQDVRKPQPVRTEPRFANGKIRKPEVRTEPEIKAPEIAAAVAAVEKEIEKAPPVPEAAHQTPAPPSRPFTPPDLGLPSLMLPPSGGLWNRLPVVGKIGLAALIVLALGGVIFLATKSSSASAASSAPRVVEAPALPASDAGWITDWGAEPGVRRQHDISILGSSMSLTDYRMEFQAQIENKALGWVYRAQDGKDYYVSKLEIVKPGLDPAVALIRFAVIHGEEQPRSQFPLSIPAHLDTVYSIRFDAVGDHFTTWVQDQKVDDFTDDRIRTGGVGLYNEHGERLGLRGSVRVVPLVIKK